MKSKKGEGEVMELREFAIKVNSVEGFIGHLVHAAALCLYFLANLQDDNIMLNMQYEAVCT